MNIPALGPADSLATGFQLPSPDSRRARSGSLFTAALLSAGKESCTCRACQLLARLRDLMVDEAEASLDAGQG